MSNNPKDKEEAEFVMPEDFSFGLEEPSQSEPEDAKDVLTPGVMGHGVVEMPVSYTGPEDCKHVWEEKPAELQILAAEDKLIWACARCGTKTVTYSWQKP